MKSEGWLIEGELFRGATEQGDQRGQFRDGVEQIDSMNPDGSGEQDDATDGRADAD